jgi:hypothetical protein
LSNWIDTHLHLIFPDQLHYDWIAAHPLQRAFTLEEYRVEARALGIARSVYVEVDARHVIITSHQYHSLFSPKWKCRVGRAGRLTLPVAFL